MSLVKSRDHLRHQELRYHEEGACVVGPARHRLRVSRLQGERDRAGAARGLGREVGWETLLNRAGTTFRKLPEADKEGLSEKSAVALMLTQPSIIKRPVLDLGNGELLVGFKPELYGKAVTGRR